VFTRPADFADSQLADALLSGWNLKSQDLGYAPVGFGSYHWWLSAAGEKWFVTVDDLQAKRRDESEALAIPRGRLTAALTTARLLNEGGLAFVVAPVPTVTGEVLYLVDERYAVAVYPHVEGESHDWGRYPATKDRLAVVDLLIDLHVADVSSPALPDDLAVPGRDQLMAAIDDRSATWSFGPFAEPARVLLSEHAEALAGALDHYDSLVSAVTGGSGVGVLTHREPHVGNTINTPDDVVLIDWDTLLLAPRERDLWSLIEEDPAVRAYYEDMADVRLNDDALALHSMWWNLTEVSLYVADFRKAHSDTADTRVGWQSLKQHLDPSRWLLGQ
jgi:hypothetical protein